MKKILILILIQQWFIATFKGIKKEEYREITPYMYPDPIKWRPIELK